MQIIAKGSVLFAILAVFGFVSTATAAGPDIVINGGGVVDNDNSGLGDLTAIGGFVAISTSTGGPTWTARGQLQSKLVSTAAVTLATINADVVCIQAHSEGDVHYEVRFMVTRTDVDFPAVGDYGSLYVWDGGTRGGGDDRADESFADPGNADCDSVESHGPEPVISGNFTVHK